MITQLAVDTTMVSLPRRHGQQSRTPALQAAKQAKACAYAELVRASRCRLVGVAMGKGSQKVRLLAKARSRTAVKISIARWSALLTLAAHVPFGS